MLIDPCATNRTQHTGYDPCPARPEWRRLFRSIPFISQSRHSLDERWANTSLSRNGEPLALLRPVPVQGRPGRELQLLLQAQHLRVVRALQFLQLPLLPQLQDALLLSGGRGAPHEPFEVVAHRSHHKRDGEGHVRGVGPRRRPENGPHDSAQPRS